MKAEETFTTLHENHPSGIDRLLRIVASVLVGGILGFLVGLWTSSLANPFIAPDLLQWLGTVAGFVAGVAIGVGLAKFEQLSFGLVLGVVGYVIIGMVGYALMFGFAGLLIAGSAGVPAGLGLGAITGTAVGLYARLIHYRYRHF